MEKAGIFLVVCIFLPALVLSLSGFHTHREHFRDESSLIEKFEVVHPQLLVEGRRRRSPAESLSTVHQNGHRQEITFSVEGLGRRFILQLSRNRVLLPEGSRDSFYNSDGILVSRPFESIDNCYYQGIIKDLPKSTVALSTCEGIEGLIFDGKERFYIQPFEKVKNETHINPHIIFRMKDLKLPKVTCGQKDNQDIVHLLPERRNISRKRRSIESETKYIELVMVNDNSQYNYYQNNSTQRALKIANIVDSLYRPLNVRVALIELITWKDKNQIDVKEDSSITLDEFVKWRKKTLIKERKLKHDNLQLLTRTDFEGQTVGKAHVLAMCTSRSAGVVQDHSPNTAATAATLAHELGHNLGLSHDEDKCECPAKKKHQACIMSGVASHVPATDWSSCSTKEFTKVLEEGIDSCLFNYPKKLYGDPVCGNGFKEEGEECDCGNYTECERYTDNCCDPKTCKLLSHADCEQGPCCEKCKFKSSTVMCRKKMSECDLPEYCTGNSELCPSNKYVHHGRSCDGGKGYCYRGICPTHKSQCQILWGKEVNSGPELCYTANMRGTYLGSCKSVNGVFTPCKYKDIFCGMLHCNETSTDLPIIGSERNAYRYKYETEDGPVECRSATLELGNDVPDPGMAREGTKCGDNKICLLRECVNITQVFLSNPKCPAGDCSPHGICNNEGDCFCDDCWGGNDCSKSVACRFGSPPIGQSKLAGYVILAFLCIALVGAGVGAFIFRDQLKTKWKERQNDKQRRYKSVETKSSQSPPGNRSTDPPTVTIAPKPPHPPPSRPAPKRQPGKIELPSWPVENNIDDKTITPAQRRQPPGIPKQSSLHRASSPPMGSYDPKNVGKRPGSYAGVLDTKPLNKPPPVPSSLSGQTGRPLLPSEIKRSQDFSTGPEVPSRPARMPPPPPKKPPIPGLPAKR